MIVFKYYNKDFLVQNKLNDAGTLILIDTIFNWIFATKHPQYKIIEGEIYFYISQQYIARLLDSVINYVTVNRKFGLLKSCGIIKNQVETTDRKVFYCFNWDIAEKCLASENELGDFKNDWFDVISDYKNCKINSYNYVGSEEEKMLFDPIEIEERKGYSEQSERLVTKIIKKNRDLFSNQLPEDRKDGKKTKTYIFMCKTVQDIFNGNFINSRIYPLSEKFLNNKQFDISGYRETIKEVKGDWNKVQKLMFTAVQNFKLMFEESRMPFDKKYLQNNFSLWLYDKFSNKGEPQSQFILCLKEPNKVSEQLSENKADRIYGELSGKVKKYGNVLYDMNKNMSAGTFWENIKKMVEWGNEVCKIDNAGYWISSGADLVKKFAEYCKSKNVQISPTTVDVQRSMRCFAPFAWFVKEACAEHSIDSRIIDCGTVDELRGLKNQKKKVKLDDLIFNGIVL